MLKNRDIFTLVATLFILIGIITLIALNTHHKYYLKPIVQTEVIEVPVDKPSSPRPHGHHSHHSHQSYPSANLGYEYM